MFEMLVGSRSGLCMYTARLPDEARCVERFVSMVVAHPLACLGAKIHASPITRKEFLDSLTWKEIAGFGSWDLE